SLGYRETCPYCVQQKGLFGKYIVFIEAHECTNNTWCQKNNISVVPTWIGPGGKRLEGFQYLSWLARESGCGFD
ncbi:MAG: hypothetical protein ABH950_01385, partial [Candidatus Altiarchaeota archaeon]